MEPDFRLLTRAFNRAGASHHFYLTAWVFLPGHSHFIVALRNPVDTVSRRAYHSLQEVMNSDFPTPVTMSTIVRVQRKGQVTIPTRLRAQVGLVDGDFVEARAHRGKIVLTPKSVVDREYKPAQRRAIDARLAEELAHEQLLGRDHREIPRRPGLLLTPLQGPRIRHQLFLARPSTILVRTSLLPKA